MSNRHFLFLKSYYTTAYCYLIPYGEIMALEVKWKLKISMITKSSNFQCIKEPKPKLIQLNINFLCIRTPVFIYYSIIYVSRVYQLQIIISL